MIGHAECLAGNFTQHAPPNKENDQGCDLCCKGQGRKVKEEREAHLCADRTRGARAQTGAKSQRNEVHGAREEESFGDRLFHGVI